MLTPLVRLVVLTNVSNAMELQVNGCVAHQRFDSRAAPVCGRAWTFFGPAAHGPRALM